MAPTFLFRAPSAALHGIIACHQIIRLRFSPDRPVPLKAYWPRPAMSLAFYPRDAEQVLAVGDKTASRKPRAALIGQPTLLTQRQGGHDFSVYQIEFQPGALHRLTGLPAARMTDCYLDAEDVFPLSFRALVDAIEDADDPDTMVRLAESWLLTLLPARATSACAWIAHRLMSGTTTSLDALAAQAAMDTRQLRRMFAREMGVGPKLYGRIARFDRAVRLHNRQPVDDWLSIAIDAGYYDHQHMARDFRDFTGISPTRFAALEQDAPERSFGLCEQ